MNSFIFWHKTKSASIIAQKLLSVFSDIPLKIKEIKDQTCHFISMPNQNNLFFIIFSVCEDNRIPSAIEDWIKLNITEGSQCIIIILCDLDNINLGQQIISEEIYRQIQKNTAKIPISPLLFDTQLGQELILDKSWIDAVTIFLKTGVNSLNNQLLKKDTRKTIAKKIITQGDIRLEYLREDTNKGTKISFINATYSYKRSTINNITKDNLKSVVNLLLTLPNVNYLSLANAKLKNWPYFPNTLYNSIEYLDIRGNNLKDYSFLNKFINLKKLNIAANNINEIPNEIYQLKYLEILFLHKNFISTIDKKIGNLKNLKRLTLYRNNLKTLPIEISDCINLKSINLGANPIDLLNINLFALKNVEELILRNCNLKVVDRKITNLRNLKVLDVSKNNNLQLIL